MEFNFLRVLPLVYTILNISNKMITELITIKHNSKILEETQVSTNNNLINELQFKLIKELEDFVFRFGNNDFHGGKSPDLADITVFSMLASRNYSKHWNEFVDHAFKGKLNEWHFKMQRLCNYKFKDGATMSLTENLDY